VAGHHHTGYEGRVINFSHDNSGMMAVMRSKHPPTRQEWLVENPDAGNRAVTWWMVPPQPPIPEKQPEPVQEAPVAPPIRKLIIRRPASSP
jgi:hypothetical protein